jgi:di/tricarboxylate transporter
MSQSRTGSLMEAIYNVMLGYAIAVASQVAIFPLFGINIPLTDNLLIGLYFTAISLARSYVLRRLFNRLTRSSEQCSSMNSTRSPGRTSS